MTSNVTIVLLRERDFELGCELNDVTVHVFPKVVSEDEALDLLVAWHNETAEPDEVHTRDTFHRQYEYEIREVETVA